MKILLWPATISRPKAEPQNHRGVLVGSAAMNPATIPDIKPCPRWTSRLLLGIAVLLVFPALNAQKAMAQESRGGTTAANFLKIGVGARPLGMGGAYVAIADDSSSAYWNPAGLANMDAQVIQLEHAEWYEGIQYEYFVVAQPAESFGLPIWGAMAFSWYYLHMGDIQRTLEDNMSGDVVIPGGSYSAADSILAISYGGQLTNFQAFGIGLKFLNQKLDYLNNSGMAFDFGIQSAAPLKNLKIGLTLSNMGQDFMGSPLPTTFKMGVNYKLAGRGFPGEWNNEIDGLLPLINSDQIPQALFGSEYAINMSTQKYSFRVGYDTGREIGTAFTGLSLGLGYLIRLGRLDLGIDYAYLFQGDFGATHHFTLNLTF